MLNTGFAVFLMLTNMTVLTSAEAAAAFTE